MGFIPFLLTLSNCFCPKLSLGAGAGAGVTVFMSANDEDGVGVAVAWKGVDVVDALGSAVRRRLTSLVVDVNTSLAVVFWNSKKASVHDSVK